MKQKVIDFAIGFIQRRTYKSVLSHMKTDLPKLLGFSYAEVFMLDRTNKSLFCLSVRPSETEAQEQDKSKRPIEEEFTINER